MTCSLDARSPPDGLQGAEIGGVNASQSGKYPSDHRHIVAGSGTNSHLAVNFPRFSGIFHTTFVVQAMAPQLQLVRMLQSLSWA